jgi:hypothetical protein
MSKREPSELEHAEYQLAQWEKELAKAHRSDDLTMQKHARIMVASYTSLIRLIKAGQGK